MVPQQLTPGRTLPAVARGRITPAQLHAYAQASGDFNPIHLDPEAARASGLPGVIAHGMLGMGFLGSYVAALAGNGFVRRLKARFVNMVPVGEELTCCGRAERVEPGADGLDVLLHVQLLNSAGAAVIEGEAVLRIV